MVSHGARATPLGEALEALIGGATTATALTLRALDAAEAATREVRAFSAIAREQALEAAADSDRRYAEGRPRLLEGLPIAVKDLIDTAGIETRYGSAAYRGHVPERDADVVRALREQGAVIVGKTTTHEFAWGVTTASTAFGDTLNPLDTTRIPGGSSGGAGAAIAFGAVAASLGTDTGGSVRIPASLCGVVGFKPTLGAFSTGGIFPLSATLDHPGVLGATVEDVQLLARALGIRGAGAAAQQSARLGVVRGVAPVPMSDEVAAAFDGALTVLAHACILTETDTADLFDGVFHSFAGIVLTEGGVAHYARSDEDWIAANYGAETVERLVRSKSVVLSDYAAWQQNRRRFAARLACAMSSMDFLVLPTTPCTAPAVGAATVQIGAWNGTVREALMTYTAPFNMAGYPAISIPLQPRAAGLPAGLQIVARPGQDAALLQFARKVQLQLAVY